MLFVSGLELKDISSALASEADVVCIDLEDAVPSHRKDAAREAVFSVIGEFGDAEPELILRINPTRSIVGLRDLLACLQQPKGVKGLLLPKVECQEDVRWVSDLAGEAGVEFDLYAIIETNEGLENCRGIAAASTGLKGLVFGGFDLSTALGCSMDWEALLYARSRVIHAAATVGIDVIDSPHPYRDDLDGVRQSANRGKSLGMTGRVAKHEAHVRIINAVYTPTHEEIERAKKILRDFDQNDAQSIMFEGKLIELPSIRSIRKIANYKSDSGSK